MTRGKGHLIRLIAVGAWFAALLALVAACAGEKTPTPAPSAPPTPTRVAPAAATPTAAPAPAVVTPTPAPQVGVRPQYSGVLRYAHRVKPDTLDPAHSGVADIYPPGFALFDRLLQADKDGILMPLLAKSWQISSDGKDVTFNLESGVKFQDGTPFNAQAVKWNFDRMLDPNELSPRKAELSPYIKSVDVVNDTTVLLRLNAPSRPLLPLLATDRPGFLVSPAAVAKYGGGKAGGFGRNPVGAGPFSFVEWVPGSHILLKKNDNYWQKGKPYLDGIRLQAVEEPSVRLAMLRTGESDILWKLYVRPQDLPIIKSNPNLKTIVIEGAQVGGLLFNVSIAPFDNKALRQAVAYAVDREQFIQVAWGGDGRPAYTMEESGWAHNPAIRPFPFDIKKAKGKLAEAGYPKGVTIPLAVQAIRGANAGIEEAEIYQAMLKEAGINVDIKTIDPGRMFGPTGALKTVGFKVTGWSHRADLDIRLRWIYYPEGFYNIAGYKNPEVIRLMDEAVALYDTAKAKPIYDRIQTITSEEAIWVYVGWRNNHAAMNKKIQGYVPHTTIGEELQWLWLER